jgi:hypothetical protein
LRKLWPPKVKGAKITMSTSQHLRFFYWRIFGKSLPKKYDFDLKEGFSMKKNGPNSPDFEKEILSIARLLLLVPVSSQKYRKILIFF